MVTELLDGIVRILVLYEEQEWMAVIVVTFVALWIGNMSCRSDYATRRTAAVLTLPYLLFRYTSFTFENGGLLFESIFRLLFLYLFSLGLSRLLLPILFRCYRDIRGRRWLLRRWWKRMRKEAAERREEKRKAQWARNHPLPPPVPRSVWMEQQLATAQANFDLEAQLLEQTHALDDDERYVGRLKAKQRLLQRIEGIMG